MLNVIDLPVDVKFIINTLENHGYEAFAVGGCIRDIIRGVNPKDWDIATSATPTQAKALFLRTIDTGIKHGTITVLINKTNYEVTTYRIDGKYSDNRRPETVTFSSSIEEDLSRRDFTMNAIAYNSKNGFVDPFNGQDDIKKGIIRCVGVAKHRFSEDALRMLRAVRFGAVTGYKLDNDIIEAIKDLKKNLSSISPERIKEELCKLICGKHPQMLNILENTGLMTYVLQGCSFNGNLQEIIKNLNACPKNEGMCLALFLHWTKKDCANILRDLRFDNKTIKETSLYVEFLNKPLPVNKYEIKKQLGVFAQSFPQNFPNEAVFIFENFLVLKGIFEPVQIKNINEVSEIVKTIIKNKECFTLKTLALSGKDLRDMGIEPGEKMGEILNNLLEIVLNNPQENTKENLRNYITL